MRNLIFTLLTLVFTVGFAQSPTAEFATSGLKNYVKNPSGLLNKTGVTASSGSTLTINTSSPLFGKQDFALNATASSQTFTWATNTFDNILKGKNCEAKFTFSGDASLYKAYVKQGSTQVTSDLTLTNETNAKDVSMNFPCGDLSTATTVVIESTGDGAAIKVSGVYAGAATNIGAGNLVLDLGSTLSYTPNGFGTVTATNYKTKRVGNILEVSGHFTSGTVAASTASISLPTGLTIDTSAISSSAAGTKVGDAFSNFGVTTFIFPGSTGSSGASQVVFYDGSTNDRVFFAYRVSGGAFLKENGSAIYANSNIINFSFKVPISQWSGATTAVKVDQTDFGVTAFSGAITSTGTPPTKGTIAYDNARYWREGEFMWVEYDYRQSAANGSNGTGTYYMLIPGGWTIDTSYYPAQGATANVSILGTGRIGDATNGANQTSSLEPYVYDSTHVGFQVRDAITGFSTWTAGSPANTTFASDALQFSLKFKVKIQGWTKNQNAPLLVGGVTSSSTGTERIERASVSTGCVISSNTPIFSGCSGTTAKTLTFSPAFLSAPVCVATVIGVTNNYLATINSPTTSSVVVNTTDAGAGTGSNQAFNIICMGPR